MCIRDRISPYLIHAHCEAVTNAERAFCTRNVLPPMAVQRERQARLGWGRELSTDQAYFCYSLRLEAVVFDVSRGTKVGGCEGREKMSMIIGQRI